MPFVSLRGKTDNCNMCHGKLHKMKTSYYNCSNKPCLEIDSCPVQYKTTICLKNKHLDRQKVKLFKLKGKDNKSTEIENKVRGLTEKVKQANEDIINDYDAKPKRIFIRLTTKDKYKDIIDIKPTLLEIQNYINYRRGQIGNKNYPFFFLLSFRKKKLIVFFIMRLTVDISI
jgi:hypothetical protein